MALDPDVRELDPLGDGTAVPIEVHEALRERCPVMPLGDDAYYLSRYDDVQLALKSVDSFVGSFREPGVVVPEEEKLINEIAEPRHGKIRRMINTAITGHRIDGIGEFTYDLASSLLAPLVGSGEVELVVDLIRPIPPAVVCELLRIQREDHAFWVDWVDEIANDPWIRLNRNDRGEGFAGAFPEANERLMAVITTRRASDDRTDFIARLGQAEIDGRTLTDLEMRSVLIFLFSAGGETTRNVLGHVLAELTTDRERFELMREDRSLIEPALEETLRLHPPLPYMQRYTSDDVEIGGHVFRPGERAIFGLSSANRDERKFECPHEMRFDRPDPRSHLSFGDGPHVCPGASLARLEMRSTLNAFFDAVGSIEAASGWEFVKEPIWWTDGPRDLRVVLQPPEG